MIRIAYMSDLHLELERWRLGLRGWSAFLARRKAIPAHPRRGPFLDNLGKIDLVVMAGDIHNGLRGIVYADQVAKYLEAPVVYVAGNHEYYHHAVDQLLPAFFRAAEHTRGRVHFLEKSVASFLFSGQRLNVLGATLWTDYALGGNAPTAMSLAARSMNDHFYISSPKGVFTPQDALAHHLESRAWLHKTLAGLRRSVPEAQNIIVTHHAPTPAVLGKRSGIIAPAYASDMLVEFANLAPTAWIHGHTHHRHETEQAGIRLVSAPRGYVSKEPRVLTFRPGVLEI
jgi:predicted phosphodiesterase